MLISSEDRLNFVLDQTQHAFPAVNLLFRDFFAGNLHELVSGLLEADWAVEQYEVPIDEAMSTVTHPSRATQPRERVSSSMTITLSAIRNPSHEDVERMMFPIGAGELRRPARCSRERRR
jgi:hypothetical protein